MRSYRIFAVAMISLLLALPAVAQDTADRSITVQHPRIRTDEMFLQADQLVFDTARNSVTMQGRVEMLYGGQVQRLSSDQVIYDGVKNTLMAQGNVVLKDRSGNTIRANRYLLDNAFRSAFVRSLKSAIKNKQIVVTVPGWN